MFSISMAADRALPVDDGGALAGRVWRPDVDGPSIVAIRGGQVVDISRVFLTMRDLCEAPDPAQALRYAEGDSMGPVASILANTPPDVAIAATRGCWPRSIFRPSKRRE